MLCSCDASSIGAAVRPVTMTVALKNALRPRAEALKWMCVSNESIWDSAMSRQVTERTRANLHSDVSILIRRRAGAGEFRDSGDTGKTTLDPGNGQMGLRLRILHFGRGKQHIALHRPPGKSWIAIASGIDIRNAICEETVSRNTERDHRADKFESFFSRFKGNEICYLRPGHGGNT
jgi:hypothetical protein